MTAEIKHFTCALCEAMCGLSVEVDSGQVLRIEGDKDDVLSQGHVCPKALSLKELHEDPDRLRHPLRRVGNDHVPVSWSEALDEVAERLHGTQVAHGDDAVGAYIGNPAVHNTGALLYGPPLLRALHTKNRFSATSVDQLPHMFANFQVFGHQLMFPVPDIDRSDFFVIVGANPLASNGSLMSAPDVRRRLQAVMKRGEVVVIDPRRTETARFATRHHFIRPGKDAWLLAAMIREVLVRGHRLGRLEDFTDGIDALSAAVDEVTVERAADHCGMDADAIVSLVDGLLSHPRAVVYGRMGTSVQELGGLCAWMLIVLNALTGHLDKPGGLMFPVPAIDLKARVGGIGVSRGHFGRWKSRVRGLQEFGSELPVACLAEEITTPGPGQIRALLTLAGNPVLSTPSGHALDEALSKLDFMVSIDPYLNETTRHADIVLPPASPLEREHMDVVFQALAVRNTVKYSPPVLELPAGAKHDWQILAGLTVRLARLRHGSMSRQLLEASALQTMGPTRLLDLGLRIGPYGAGVAGAYRADTTPRLSLRVLSHHPHGIDLGPLTPGLPERLPTGRIDLAPEPLIADVPRMLAQPKPEGLMLIGRRHLRSNNSWMHNAPKLMTGRDRCTLMMHPDDAASRGIESGSRVRVSSRVGSVDVAAALTDDIAPGVVSLPHGFGHHRAGARLSTAAQHAGVSANDLTDAGRLDELTGNAVLNGVPVEVALL